MFTLKRIIQDTSKKQINNKLHSHSNQVSRSHQRHQTYTPPPNNVVQPIHEEQEQPINEEQPIHEEQEQTMNINDDKLCEQIKNEIALFLTKDEVKNEDVKDISIYYENFINVNTNPNINKEYERYINYLSYSNIHITFFLKMKFKLYLSKFFPILMNKNKNKK